MEDSQIIDLYWQRKENAISETASKYGNYLYQVSYHIVTNREDAEECVNDTYNAAWEAMPPHRPNRLSTFLGKITRRFSIDLWRKNGAQKRGNGEIVYALDELEECLSWRGSVESTAEQHELQEILNNFVKKLPRTERRVFLARYWYLYSISDISNKFGFSESKVKSMLFRIRNELRKKLEEEGY